MGEAASPLAPPAKFALQTPASAPGTPTSAPPAPAAAKVPRGKLTLSGSWRVRQEFWDWFGSGGEGRYTYTGSLLRFGGLYTTPDHDLALELAQPTLLNLPKDATLGAPLGQFGTGPTYRDSNVPQEASLFVKQAYWRAKNLGSPANSARLGRFEFVDGSEPGAKDPSIAWLKSQRIAHRLLGTFAFTHVGRSFDGGQFVHQAPGLNVTLFAGMPTEGVFDLDGGTTLEDIKVGYASVTHPYKRNGFNGEARLFGSYYLDGRKGVTKVDNRPGPVRAADRNNLSIGTIGGHAVGVWDTPGGKLDGLLWGAEQFGDFGSQSHGAFALAVEAGYQPKNVAWSPWLRVGFNHYSGDDDPTDSDHGTFFPMLPTPRIYAMFPFYTMANLNDVFGQVLLKPSPKWKVRADVHCLSLAEEMDLWYIGGGAFQRPTFGYGGRPSNGARGLATLLDVGADYQFHKNTTLSGYLGYAIGGDVVDRIYSGSSDGLFGYVEILQKF